MSEIENLKNSNCEFYPNKNKQKNNYQANKDPAFCSFKFSKS